jgi:RNA polymerase sigma-70 factor (ECF subfamily)
MAMPRRSDTPSHVSWLRQLGDEELMGFVAKGDPRAFETIYDRHCTAVFSLAYRICGVRSTADEVAQEAFLAIWRSGGRYDRTRGSVRSWLLTIVHNAAIDMLRRATAQERNRAADDQAADVLEAPERTDVEAARREAARSVRTLIEELPRDQRRVVELAYFGGFTHEEIAQMLDAPLGTVKGRMRLALEKMRLTMTATGVTL